MLQQSTLHRFSITQLEYFIKNYFRCGKILLVEGTIKKHECKN
jgi:hypothetical protein